MYEETLYCVEEVIQSAREARLMNILGIDANAVIGARAATDDVNIVGAHGMGQRNHRGDMFTNWAHGMRMAAVNTMFQKPWEETWTHESWFDQTQRQIDFVLIDEVRRDTAVDSSIAVSLDGKSDHRGVHIFLYSCLGTQTTKSKENPERLDTKLRPNRHAF